MLNSVAIRSQHMLLATVAVAYSALAFADGGHSASLIAAGTIAIWWVIIVGLVARVWPREPVPRHAVVAGGSLAALACLTALSLAWAEDAGRAFEEVVRVAGYTGIFVLVALAMPRTGPRGWLIGLAIGISVVALAALATRFDTSLFGGPDRELFAEIPSAQGRLSFPIGYWNGLAACVALGAVLLLWLGGHASSRLGRAAAVGLLPAFALTIYLAASRGGFAAAAVGAIVLVALGPGRVRVIGGLALGGAGASVLILMARQRADFVDGLTTAATGAEMALATAICMLAVGAARYLLDRPLAQVSLPRSVGRALAGAAIAAAVIAFVASGPGERLDEFSDPESVLAAEGGSGGTGLTRGGSTGRYQFWEAALDAYGSRPVTGIGAGNYELWWNVHGSLPVTIRDAHSLFLESLAELGVLGLALVLVFFGVSVLAARGRLSSQPGGELSVALGLLGAGAVSAMLDWTWEIPATLVPLLIAAGVLTGTRRRSRARLVPASRPSALEGRRGTRRERFGLGVVTIVFAWAAIWVAGVLVIGEVKLGDSREAAERGELDEAAQDARDASAVQPWSPEPRLQLALVEELRGELDAAREAVSEAIDRAPTDWRPWFIAARIEAAAGDRALAREDLERANEFSPKPINFGLAPPGSSG